MFEHTDPVSRDDDDCITDCTDAESIDRWYHRQVARVQMEQHLLRKRRIQEVTEQVSKRLLTEDVPETTISWLLQQVKHAEHQRLKEEFTGRINVLKSVCRGRMAALGLL